MQLDSFEEVLSTKLGKAIIRIAFVAFSALTLLTLLKTGLLPVFATQLGTLGGIQVFVDLVIMCLLFSLWIKIDAKKTGRRFLPWFILTLAVGSIGPLLYLATRKK